MKNILVGIVVLCLTLPLFAKFDYSDFSESSEQSHRSKKHDGWQKETEKFHAQLKHPKIHRFSRTRALKRARKYLFDRDMIRYEPILKSLKDKLAPWVSGENVEFDDEYFFLIAQAQRLVEIHTRLNAGSQEKLQALDSLAQSVYNPCRSNSKPLIEQKSVKDFSDRLMDDTLWGKPGCQNGSCSPRLLPCFPSRTPKYNLKRMAVDIELTRGTLRLDPDLVASMHKASSVKELNIILKNL